MVLIEIHRLVANAFMYFALIIAFWALLHLIRSRELSGDFWGAVVIGEVLILAQVILGVVMVIMGLRPGRWMHYLYGVVALITWPALFAFTRGESNSRAIIVWATVSLFLFGIALRAAATALPL